MSWEVSVRRRTDLGPKLLGNATFQREWGSLFYGSEVYDPDVDNAVAGNGTFIVDVAFKPRWEVLLQKLEPMAALDPTGEGKVLVDLIRQVLATGSQEDYVIVIG